MITKNDIANSLKQARQNAMNGIDVPASTYLRNLLLQALSSSENELFDCVSFDPDGLTARQIAEMAKKSETNVSNILKRLVEWGLVERKQVDGVFLYFVP